MPLPFPTSPSTCDVTLSNADPTLTKENVLLVLDEVKNLTMLCRYLRDPVYKKKISKTIVSVAEYFISYSCHPTWLKLASKLYYLNEETALSVCKRFIPTPSPGEGSKFING